jgi:hypothetical protein
MTSVTSVVHVAAGAKPVLLSSAGNEGVENQLGPLRVLLAVDAERVGRLVGRRARLMIRRRVRVDRDPSSTGASHPGVAIGRVFTMGLSRGALPELGSQAVASRWRNL